MKKRYQVFVSSTFLDLREERQEVIQALLELSCIPAGMELFPAANDDQWTLIKDVINDCDYYLVIIGGRYGSTGMDGRSYTEMEYRYALEIGKPTIAFIHNDPGMLPANRTEPTPEGREKLDAFRALVKRKVVRFWKSPADLGSVVSRSLIHLIQSVPATGWIRADQLQNQIPLSENLLLDKNTIKEKPVESGWSHTGNLYWLGHDLMWTMAVLLSEGMQDSVSHGLRQAHHHLCQIGMGQSPYAGHLTRWLYEVETAGDDWSIERRRHLAGAIDRLADQIGALAETHQHSFRAGPED